MNPSELPFRFQPKRKRNYAADEKLHPVQIAGYRKMTPAEKIDRIAAFWKGAQAMMAGGIRHRHPDWTDEQVAAELRRRMLYGVT
jgi:hypothetical protein